MRFRNRNEAARELIPYLNKFYSDVEERTEKKLITQRAIIKPFVEEQEKKLWQKKASAELSDESIRKELTENLKNAGDYILVNYSRKALAQEGSGHVSPIGAYDKKSDSFLVMDVSPNTANWVWVSAHDLISAMRTFDTIENRGYVLVKEGSSKK